MPNNQQEKRYFNLQANGVGYANRVREVKPENGDPFYALDISALRGNSEEIKYTNFALRVVGEEAKTVIKDNLDALSKKGNKAIMAFVVGDIQPKSFTYQKDGQTKQGVNIDGRLIKIVSLKINGNLVFKSETKAEGNGSTTKIEQQPSTKDDESDTAFYINPESGEMLSKVSLAKDDADFSAKKDALKEAGYSWNQDQRAWVQN